MRTIYDFTLTFKKKKNVANLIHSYSKTSLTSLPSFIIETICALLINCGCLNSVLSLRATNSFLYCVINNSRLLVSWRVHFQADSEFDREIELTERCLQHLQTDTDWKIRQINFIGTKKCKTYDRLLNVVSECKQLFSKLRLITLKSVFETTTLDILEQLFQLVCNDKTSIHVATLDDPSLFEDYTIAQRITKLRTFSDVINSSFHILITFDNVFPNLESIQVNNSRFIEPDDDILLLYNNVRQFPPMVMVSRFSHLREVEFTTLAWLINSAKYAQQSLFPRVQSLKVSRFRNDIWTTGLLTDHFPIVNFLKLRDAQRSLSGPIGERIQLPSDTDLNLHDTCSTLVIDASIAKSVVSKTGNLTELCLIFAYGREQFYRKSFEDHLARCCLMNLKVLNIVFSVNCYGSEFFGAPFDHQRDLLCYGPQELSTENNPFTTECLLNASLKILKSITILEIYSMRGEFWVMDDRIDIQDLGWKQSLSRWRKANQKFLDSNRNLKVFVFGDSVMKASGDISMALMQRINCLDCSKDFYTLRNPRHGEEPVKLSSVG